MKISNQVETSNSIEMVKAAEASNVEQLNDQEVAMETSVTAAEHLP